MSTIGQLLVELGLDASRFKSGIGEAGEHAKGLGGVLQTALGTAAGFLTGGLITDGIGKIGEFLKSSAEAAREDQEGMAQLGAVLKSTNGAAGMTAETADTLAGSLSGVTRFSRDAALGAENMLLTFTNIKSNVFPQATKTVLDMSQALGQDTKSSAIQLGKALNDPIHGMTALSRVGVTFTQAQKDQIKALQETGDMMGAQKVILSELATEFGGSAEAAGKTAAGQADIMSHKFEEIQEKVGGVLLNLQGKLMTTFGPFIITLMEGFTALISDPAVTTAIDAISSGLTIAGQAVSGFLEEFNNAQNGGGASDIFAGIANGLASVSAITHIPIFDQIGSVVAVIGDAWPTIVTTVTTVFNQVAAVVGPIIDGIIAAVAAVVTWVIANWPQISAAISSAFETARSIVEPIITSIFSVVSTVFAMLSQFLAEHGEEIRGFIAGAWQKIQGIIQGVVEVIQLTIVPIWQGIAKFISENQDTIKAVIELIWNGIKLTISTVITIVDGIIQTFLKILKGDWKGAWDVIEATAKGVWKNIQDFFGSIPAALTKIGQDIIDGIVLGFNSAKAKVEEALSKIIMDAIQHIKDLLGIKSPSTVFAAMGENMMLGLAGGISGFGDLPQVRLRGVVDGITGAQAMGAVADADTPHGASATASGGAAQVNVYLDGQLIGHAMGQITYSSLQAAY